MNAASQPGYDAIVVGAASVGTAAALALARLGRKVALIDRSAPRELADDAPLDPRVVAVSPGSMLLLEALGARRHLHLSRIAPYHDMQVVAGRGSVEFHAPEHGLETLGWIAELPELDRSLWRAASGDARINALRPVEIEAIAPQDDRVRLTLSDGRMIEGTCLIGADGARSRVRRAAAIGVTEQHYNQRAIVAHLDSEKLNPGIAWQRFTELGPMALLPLPEGRSSLVWSVHEDQAARLMALDDDEFLARLTGHAGEQPFGAIEAVEPRHAIELVRRQSERLAAGRIALVGDAAHSVHPLAGQGLNLGLGDVAALIDVLADWNPASNPAARLERYSRRRGSDARLVASGIHLFNELPRTLGAFGRPALAAGFTALRLARPARDAFVQRACGLREADKAACILNPAHS